MTLLGCNSLALPGATVVLKLGGTTLATQTTNGSGVTVFTGLSPGTYTVTYSASRFTTVGPINVTIDGICTAMTAGTTLSPSGGYGCCVGCVYPYPSTVFITTSAGTVTGTLSAGRWNATQGVTVNCGNGAGLTTLSYSLGCSAGTFGTLIIEGDAVQSLGGTWFLTQTPNNCFNLATHVFPDGTATDGSPCAEPLNLSMTAPATLVTGGGVTVTCPISGAITITE